MLLDGDVQDAHRLAVLDEGDLAVEELGGDEGLARTLLEPAKIHGAGDDDLAGVDPGDAPHGDEDPPPPLHLDDEPGEARRVVPGTQDDEGIANLAHLIAIGIEHPDAGEAGKEHPGRSACRHDRRLPSHPWSWPGPRGPMRCGSRWP